MAIVGRRRGTSWTGHQLVAGSHTYLHPQLDIGTIKRNQSTFQAFFGTAEEARVSGAKARVETTEPGHSCCEAKVLTTAPLYPIENK